jgi:hypothetical protein
MRRVCNDDAWSLAYNSQTSQSSASWVCMHTGCRDFQHAQLPIRTYTLDVALPFLTPFLTAGLAIPLALFAPKGTSSAIPPVDFLAQPHGYMSASSVALDEFAYIDHRDTSTGLSLEDSLMMQEAFLLGMYLLHLPVIVDLNFLFLL